MSFFSGNSSSSDSLTGGDMKLTQTPDSENFEEIVKSFQFALQKHALPNPLFTKLALVHNGEIFVEISRKDCELSMRSMAELFHQFALLQK